MYFTVFMIFICIIAVMMKMAVVGFNQKDLMWLVLYIFIYNDFIIIDAQMGICLILIYWHKMYPGVSEWVSKSMLSHFLTANA